MLSLRLRLMPSPLPLLSPAMVTTDTVTDTALTGMYLVKWHSSTLVSALKSSCPLFSHFERVLS